MVRNRDADMSRRRRMAAAALLRAGAAPAPEPTEAPLTPEQHWMVETAELVPEVAAVASVAAITVPTEARDRLPDAIGRALREVDAPALRLTWSLGVPAQIRDRSSGYELTTTAGEVQTLDEAAAALQRPFDLTDGPTVRIAPVTSGAGTAVVVSASRIFVDRWSCLALAARIGELVRDPGAPSRVPQRSFLRHCCAGGRSAHAPADDGRAAAAALDLTSPSLLPIDGTRTAAPPVSAHGLRDIVSWGVVRAATPAGSSVRSTILAAVVAGLARLGGSDLIRVGITERTADADRYDVIGCGTTTTLGVYPVPATRTFRELVGDCGRQTTRAHLRDVLRAAEDGPGNEPIVGVGVEFVGPVDASAGLGTPQLLASTTPLYEVNVVCHEAPECIELICEYRPDLLTADTIRSLLACWTGMLTDAAGRTDTPIELLSMPGLVPHVRPAVTASAARLATSVRVEFADSAGSGAELHEVSTHPDDLHEAGIDATTTVALEAGASPGFVRRLLAALALDADVVVLEPDDAPAWRQRVVDRVGADVVIYADGVVERTGRTPEGRPAEPAGLLVVQSAGLPGRILRLPVESLLAAAGAAASVWGLHPGARLAHTASWASEDAVVALLAAGHTGATLVRLPATLAGPELVDVLDTSAVTAADLDEPQLATFPAVVLPPDLRLSTRIPEGTTTVRMPSDPPLERRWWAAEAPDVLLVGDRQLRLFGPAGAARIATGSGLPLPAGRSGRLWVAVTDGTRYLDDPRATADRLRPDPAGGGGRLLDSGVRARAGSDGILVVDGTEVDRVCRSGRSMVPNDLRDLLASRGVQGYADVVPDEWAVGRGTFAVLDASTGAEPDDACTMLAQSLPAVLQPRVIVGPGGVDRFGALRLAERALSRRPELAPPRPGLEAELAERVITPLLGVADPGRKETVFALGASSLQVLRMISSVNETYGVDVVLAALLQEPHIAGLAAAIERARASQENHARQLSAVLSLVDDMDDE